MIAATLVCVSAGAGGAGLACGDSDIGALALALAAEAVRCAGAGAAAGGRGADLAEEVAWGDAVKGTPASACSPRTATVLILWGSPFGMVPFVGLAATGAMLGVGGLGV